MNISRPRKSILIVLPMTPYPLRASGLSVRYLPVIQHLSRSHHVDLIIISDGKDDEAHINALKEYCRKVSVILNPKYEKHGIMEKLRTQAQIVMPWTPPRRCSFYAADKISKQIAEVTSGTHYDILLCVGVVYTPYVGAVSADRVVVDFVDSPTLSIERDVLGCQSNELLRKYEYWKMKQWETKTIRGVDACIYISPVDAQVIPTRQTTGCPRYVLSNGISVNGYSQDNVNAEVKTPNIGFLGNMSYLPNVEAVHWLHDKIFAKIRADIPDLFLYIIGRDPAESVLELGRNDGVIVTGTVDDIWSYVNAVDIFVFPLWRGTGLKNKVLEAMYAGRPVLTTHIGSEGIGATPGRDLIICDTQEQFSDEIVRLLGSAERRSSMGKFASMLVRDKFAWERILADFECAITGEKSISS